MKEYTKEELKVVLDRHLEWLLDNSKGERANLSWANLSWANLSWANLRGANLSWANLSWANLRGADLRGVNLRGANLGGSNLGGANLGGVDLLGANLGGVNLGGANLSHTCINTFSLGMHSGYSWTNSEGKLIIKIGCKEMQASQWKDEYVEIGKSQGYTDKQIKLYGSQIKLLIGDHYYGLLTNSGNNFGFKGLSIFFRGFFKW